MDTHAAGAAPAGAGRALASYRYSTSGLRESEQADAWRAQCGPTVELRDAAGPGFAASYEMWPLGPFALSRVVVPASRYARTAERIRRDSVDHWVVAVGRGGSHQLRAASGQVASAPAGVPWVMSFGEAFEARRTAGEWLMLFVSREALPEFAATLDRGRNRPLTGTMGRVMAGFFDTLAATLPTATEADLPRLVDATRAVVVAGVAPASGLPLGPAGAAEMERSRLERVRCVVRRQIASPRLTPERLGAAAGMSRSQLYRLFEPLGGVAKYVQGERLRAAQRALSDPRDGRGVAAIAEAVGFFDPSTFSRVFRREFGASPSEVRAAALAGERAVPLLRPPPGGGIEVGADFAARLRGLR